jgi:glycosyltransferase involved in cell wall biosynthesis
MSAMTVSVVIPAHNSSTTIIRAIDSAVRQTRPPSEVIVINDGSSDDTVQVATAFARSAPVPVHIHTLNPNKGPGTARNWGWDNASGDLVAFLDADDAWHPRKLEVQAATMEIHQSAVMSCSEHHFGIDDDWKSVEIPAPIVFQDLGNFLVHNRCATPTVMFRRSIPERFDPAQVFIGVEDYLLWMRVVANHGPCIKILAPLTHCSNPAFGGSGLSGRLWAMERGELAVFRTLRSEGLISTERLVRCQVWSLAKFLIRLFDQKVFPIRSRHR